MAPADTDEQKRYVSVRFPGPLKKELKAVATELDRSMVSLVIESVEKDMPRWKRKAERSREKRSH